MTRRDRPVRKTTLAEADDGERDRSHWETVPPAERVAWVFELSRRAHELAGKLPAPGQGRPRSAARLRRA